MGFFPQRQGATDTKPFLNKGIYAAGRRIKKINQMTKTERMKIKDKEAEVQ